MNIGWSSIRRRAASVALVLAGFGFLYWFFWVRPGDDDSTVLGLFVEAEMIKIARESDSDFVSEDDDLVRSITGPLIVDGTVVDAASCVAGSDWARDRVSSPDILVGTDPPLVRAAELYADAIEAGELERARIIADVEQRYWELDADIEQVESWAEGLDDETRAVTEQYIAERAKPPTADAEGRFIVYVVQGNVWVQRIFYLDGARLQPNRIDSPSSEPVSSDQLIAGQDELESFPLHDCDDVASDWDLYDPDLPDLPPIEDRWDMETGRSVADA